jgi:hypothetical protein
MGISNDLFRVKICKPIGLAKRAPSIMNHGRFTFDSYRELKVGKVVEISISPVNSEADAAPSVSRLRLVRRKKPNRRPQPGDRRTQA